jgi:hypothetical protein
MLNPKLLATLSLGLLVAACAQPYQQQAAYQTTYPAAYPTQTGGRALSASERNCIDYGFSSPSANYDRCVQREMRARDQGRVARDYDQGRLVQDANNACYDYGLERNTQRFDNCVNREVDARRYREQGPAPAPVAYQPQPAPYYAPQPAPAPFRDEFGFRYDGEGNRIDASGRVISPYTTNR